jgi:hypothetical protein
MHPPDPQNARSPAAWENGRAKSQKSDQSNTDDTHSPLEYQAGKLCQRYCLRHAAARTVAALAFEGGRP